MKQLNTTGIILKRTNFGEADRIITMLTPDHGKLRLMARGVRKVKSKLAGGIELFSVSHITFIKGRGEINTLISTRLVKHYSRIVEDVARTMLAYELIKQLDRTTEDQPDREYYDLLQRVLTALDDFDVDSDLVKLWFAMQLLRLGGHTPNLATDASGNKLDQTAKYNFDFESMAFVLSSRGRFNANHIKFLRLGFSHHQPKNLQQVDGLADLSHDLAPLVQTMITSHIRI